MPLGPMPGELSTISDSDRVHDGDPVVASNANTAFPSVPTYTLPSDPTAGDEYTMPPVGCDHTTVPLLVVDKQYNRPLSHPTYSLKLSMLSAGEERTNAGRDTLHTTPPVSPRIAYTRVSSQPTYTVPSGPSTGDDSNADSDTLGVDHRTTPLLPTNAYM